MHYAHIFWMDKQHFQAKILQVKQIWHISQAKVYLQVGRYAENDIPLATTGSSFVIQCLALCPYLPRGTHTVSGPIHVLRQNLNVFFHRQPSCECSILISQSNRHVWSYILTGEFYEHRTILRDVSWVHTCLLLLRSCCPVWALQHIHTMGSAAILARCLPTFLPNT